MSVFEHSTRRARRELALVVILPIVCYALSVTFEFHERTLRWLAYYERWQLDELPLALLVLACGLAWYAWRRRAEAQHALELHARAEMQAKALLARNRALAQSLISLQESERLSLARELHDEIGQSCTALRLETAVLQRCAPDDADGMRAAAGRADAAAQSIFQLVRNLLRRLRPAHLDTLGLVPALQELCESWEQRSGVACVFHGEGVEGLFADATAVAVYRIAQEALTNVMRHARAATVRLVLVRSAAEVRLTVQDDGVGMDPAQSRCGLGLLGASERAAALGGVFAVHGAPGAGVMVELRLPLAGRPSGPARVSETNEVLA